MFTHVLNAKLQLNGNVTRLMSRVLALHTKPKGKASADVLRHGATAMVENTDAPGNGKVNYALIELGAPVIGMLCKARPRPRRLHCDAFFEIKVGTFVIPSRIVH